MNFENPYLLRKTAHPMTVEFWQNYEVGSLFINVEFHIVIMKTSLAGHGVVIEGGFDTGQLVTVETIAKNGLTWRVMATISNPRVPRPIP